MDKEKYEQWRREILGNPLMEREWITPAEASKVLGVSHASVLKSIYERWFEGRPKSIGFRQTRWEVSTASIRKRVEEATDLSNRSDDSGDMNRDELTRTT